jgi:hypothetical protein
VTQSINQIWFATYIATLFTSLQISATFLKNPQHLWLISGLLGFAYGNMFALLPIITLEWFGMMHFSAVCDILFVKDWQYIYELARYYKNWGTVSLAPAFGGNLANLLFGFILDRNTVCLMGFPKLPCRHTSIKC